MWEEIKLFYKGFWCKLAVQSQSTKNVTGLLLWAVWDVCLTTWTQFINCYKLSMRIKNHELTVGTCLQIAVTPWDRVVYRNFAWGRSNFCQQVWCCNIYSKGIRVNNNMRNRDNQTWISPSLLPSNFANGQSSVLWKWKSGLIYKIKLIWPKHC